MKIDAHTTDEALLKELGGRLMRGRLERDLTQGALAQAAGVSKRTVERLESGEVASRLSGFVRVCRALGLAERLDALLPDAPPSPMAQLKLQGRKRKRASGTHLKATPPQTSPKSWTWGEGT